MKNHALISTALIFASCSSIIPLKQENIMPTTPENTDTWVISPHRVNCTGITPMKCLLVKKRPSSTSELFYDEIKGFNYVEGYEYTIVVKSNPIINPPADASSIQYSLIKILNRTAKP